MIVFVVSMIGNIIAVCVCKNLKTQNDNLCNSFNELEEYNLFMKDALLTQLSMQDDCCKILQNENWSNGIDIDSVSLIYRYTDAMCQSCLDSELNLLSDFIDNVGKAKLLILPLITDYRDSRIRVKSRLREFNYLILDDSLLGIPVNDVGIPNRYFAFVNGDGKLEEIYFPNENMEVTSFYIKQLINKIKMH